MKKTFSLLAVFFIFISFEAFAQNSFKDMTPAKSQMTNESPVGGPQHSVQSLPQEKLNKIKALSADLTAARISGDVQKTQLIQKQIDNLTGVSIPYNTNPGPQAICEVVNKEILSDNANYGFLIGGGFWSTATCTDEVTGRIYILGTSYFSAVSDTLYIFTSLNGINWTLLNRVAYGSVGVHYRNDELSCVAINDGSGGSYLYYSAGFNYSTNVFATVGRIKSDGTMFFSGYPYSSGPANKYYYPRITSDNIRYSSNTYIYYIMTHDSTAGTLKNIYVEFGKITNPFVASPTYTSYSSGPYFGWYYFGVADSTIAYSDIAYSDSAGYDRLITVTNFYHAGAYTNLYLAYSTDLGSSNPTYIPQIVESHINYIPRIVFDQLGGTTGVIGYTRLYAGNDWDFYIQYTSNNGLNWFGTYLDGTTDTTFASDLIAVKGAAGTFKAAVSNKYGATGGNVYTRSVYISPTGVLSMPTAFKVNPILATPSFAPARAGFYYGTADSNLTVWTGAPGGTSVYFTRGGSGTITGLNNHNSIVKTYALEQNYPNPFNPTTTIQYSIPKNGLVKIVVYDILGKEVSTLVNEVKTAGIYIVDFNASSLASGIYYYKINSGDFSSVKKMMLIK